MTTTTADTPTVSDPDDLIDNIPELLQYRAKTDTDRRAFQFYDSHGFVADLTSQDVYRLSGKFAHLLKSWGFEKGEVIANGLPNSPERVVSDFGVIMSGCVLSNCQVIEKDGSDFWHCARISHCRGVIISARSHDAPNQIFSKFLSENATKSTKVSAPNGTGITMVYDVTLPQAPTIRKVIVCDRQFPLRKRDAEEAAATSGGADEEQKESLLQKRGECDENVVDGEYQRNQQEQQLKEDEHHQQGLQDQSFLEGLKALDDQTEFYQAQCDTSDLALLLSTSGTTGFNKLVPGTHKYMLETGRAFGKEGRNYLNYNDRPLGWMGGYPLDYLNSGSCRVLLDSFNNEGMPSPRELWDIVTVSKSHGVALMPFDIIRLVDEFEHNPPEYKALYFSTGGQAIRQEMSKCLGLLCQALIVSYGCSEGGAFTIGFLLADKDEKLSDFYCGTVYKGGCELKIVDEEGQEVEVGKDGEIYVKCERIIKAYYDLEASTTDSETRPKLHTEDGWYKTGDRGMLTAEGGLFCYGRQGDVTSVNGVIIYLSWLESILNKCTRIQNSSVIALSDDVESRNGDGGAGAGGAGGVTFCGFVEPKTNDNLTEEEVKEFFLENIVDTEYKDKLKLSHVFIVDTLPLIPSRKVNKRALIQMAKEKLDLF